MNVMNVQEVLDQGDEDDLFELWRIANQRSMWQRSIRKAAAAGRTEDVMTMRRALGELPVVTPLEALRANRRLVELLTGRRWTAMEAAREDRASWAEIGEALGMSRQAAWEWYERKIELQERYVGDLHDADRVRAALGDSSNE